MRHPKSLESLILATAVTGVLLVASAAHAQSLLGTGGTTGTTGTTSFATTDFLVSVQAVPGVSLSAFNLQRFFNVARCECATPVTIFVGLLPSGVAKRSTVTSQAATATIWLGTNCVLSGPGQATGNCRRLASEPALTFLNKASWSVLTDARTISTYLPSGTSPDAGLSSDGCTSTIGIFPQPISVTFDFDGDTYVDLSVPLSVNVDLTPPPQPMGVSVEGGEEAVATSWTALDSSIVTDLLGYQILCSRADYYKVFNETQQDGGATNGPFGASFQTCPGTSPETGVEGLDPTFVCSPLLQPDVTSYRVEVLQNEITYAVGVVAVDNNGNASRPVEVHYGTPTKTLNFYDVYRNGLLTSNNTNIDAPGGASGGFCAVAAARPRGKTTAETLGLILLGAVGLIVARRRRRRR